MLKEQQTMKSTGSTPSFEARLLLREFSHRVNNEFASVIGAISIAVARSTNDEAKLVLAAVAVGYKITHWCTMRCRYPSIPVASTRPHISDNYANPSVVQDLKARASSSAWWRPHWK
jgi:hypothetical protein